MKKTINVLFAFTFALSCFFTSCANLEDSFTSENGDNGGKPTYSISGTVTGLGFEGQEPRDNSRTAMSNLSDIEEENIKYTVKAQKGDLVVTKEGSPFTLALPSAGEWTVSATGVDKNTQSTVLSTDSKVIFISPVSPTGYVNLEARPVITDDGFGKINLSFGTLPSKVRRVEVECNDANWQALLSDNNLVVNKSGIKTSGDVKSGSYTVDINFYDSSDVLCYNCTQTINVFNGFTTNTWIKHGSESYLEYKTAGSQKPGSAADFKLTDALLDQYVLRTIYVDPSFTGTSTGTWLAPYKSFWEAYTASYSGLNSGAFTESTIFVKGRAEDDYKVPVSNQILLEINSSNKLTIKSWDSSHPVVLTRSSGATSTLITVNSLFTTLYLQNIILDGNNSTTAEGCIYNNGGTLDLNNVTIQNFIAKKSDNLNGSKGGGIYTKGGTVKLTDVTIKDCQVETPGVDESTHAPGGAAIYKDGGELTIAGTTVIEDNKLTDGTISNIELAYGETLKISQTGNGSHIGITKAITSGNRVDFASDKTEDISNKYFSDEGYLISTWSNKGIIAKSTGGLTAGYYEDVEFAADETEFFVGEGTSTITFSAKVGAGTDPVAIDNWNATVTYAGIDITNRVEEKTATEDKKSYKIVLPSTFPEGKYYIAVKGDYNGVTYSGTKIIKIEDSNVRKFTGANIDSVNMSKYAGKTLEFVLDSTVTASQLDSLCRKIDSSKATIDLDLSQVTNAENFRSTCYLRRHMRKIILPDNLSEFNAYTQKNYYGLYIESVEIAESNPNFKTVDGVLFNKDMTELIYYPTQNPRKTYTVPASVTRIGASSFKSIQSNTLETLIFQSPVTIVNSSFFNARISHIIFQSTSPVTLEGCVFDQLYGIVDMTFYSSTPPTLSSAGGRAEFYFGTPVNFNKFYVPAGSKSAYVNDSTWNSSSTNNLVSSKTIDQWIEEFAP